MDVIFVGCCRHRHHHLRIYFLWVFPLSNRSSLCCTTTICECACVFLGKIFIIENAWNVIQLKIALHSHALQINFQLLSRISLALFNTFERRLCEYFVLHWHWHCKGVRNCLCFFFDFKTELIYHLLVSIVGLHFRPESENITKKKQCMHHES